MRKVSLARRPLFRSSVTLAGLTCLAALLVVSAGTASAEEKPVKAELVEVRKIWDQAPHNAFTDLVRWHGAWYCVFREGKAHVSPDGSLRVLTSLDGKEWSPAALITSPTADLRDAKITVTPDDRLMLSGAGALHQPAAARHQSMVWFSRDGRQWTEGAPIGDPNMWLWRVTWDRGAAYSVGYSTDPDPARRFARLYRSPDGTRFDTLVDRLYDQAYPNEHSLLFDADGSCLCLLRRDAGPATGLLGYAKPPYTEWTWKDLGVRIGGPQMLRLPDGRIVAAVRLHKEKVRTALCLLDPKAATLTEFLALPSGGDTSYAGLAWHEGLLWVSYYSSHEGKTSIYLARVKLEQ